MNRRPHMIALDIDGTLLESGTDVPAITARVIADLRATGHHIVLATGRSLVGALPVAWNLGLADAWVVASNGAVTARTGPTRRQGHVVESAIRFDPEPVAHHVLQKMPRVGIAVEEVGHGWRVNTRFPDHRLNGTQRVVADPEELWATPVTRMALAAPGIAALLDPLRRLGVTATPDGLGWLDVTPQGLSKMTALESIRVRLGVPKDRTVASGDGWNDVAMLRWAHHSIVMGQAPLAIRDFGTQITGPVHEHGVAHALRALLRPIPQRQNVPA